MASLMTPIKDDMVTSTPISDLRKNYIKLSHNYIKLVDGKIAICPICNKPIEHSETQSGFYRESRNKSGHTWFCKECIRDMATDNKDGVRIDNKEKAQAVLKLLDWAYLDDLYKQSVEAAKNNMSERVKTCGWASYVTQLRSFHSKLTWADSKFGSDDGLSENENSRRITSVMIKRWGPGFSDSDYLTMEDHYKMLKNNNPNADSNQEIFIEDLCRTRLLMLRAMRGEGKTDDFDKFSKTYRETFKQAGLRTVEETDASNDETFGVTLAEISRYTPPEFYKNKELYKDFDGLGEYFNRFVLRPLRNLLSGGNERDSEYSIPDSE